MKNIERKPCRDCKEVKQIIHIKHKYGNFILCASCYKKRRREEYLVCVKCSICGNIKPLHVRDKLGNYKCYGCSKKDTYKYKICSVCKKLKLVYVMTISGEPVCRKCYKKDPSTYKICPICKKLKPLINRSPIGEDICHACYVKQKRRNAPIHKKCSICGKMELLHKRDKLGNYICSTCDLKKTTLSKNKSNEQSDKYIICSICQKEIPKQRCIVNEENIICLDCYYKEKLKHK